MKATCIRNYYACRQGGTYRYPNSADRRYHLNRFLDTVLAAAITVAVVAILLFLLILF